MTQLQYFTALSGLWLALAWLPYILDRVMVRGLMGAMANPGPSDLPQSLWAQRAHRAHIVGVELFAAFAPLAILAMLVLPAENQPGTLGLTFFIGMIAHYIIYTIGIPVLRTLAFAVAALSSVLLGLTLLGAA
ncbi:MAPEG family protein [Leisingera daeponensis]|uniref:MAPEG family protein n=1 Tax=Leisingera daeponensis TaxID=405746 RepID=A0ABS7NFJ8_9RHOB|nr:MAPEG family protein [Leisingera daeponensis]MBY6139978.1 MAPEG family protein [Leisingera daeponensis]